MPLQCTINQNCAHYLSRTSHTYIFIISSGQEISWVCIKLSSNQWRLVITEIFTFQVYKQRQFTSWKYIDSSIQTTAIAYLLVSLLSHKNPWSYSQNTIQIVLMHYIHCLQFVSINMSMYIACLLLRTHRICL